jgi:TRAP-type C4-dicarboxylate transport system permease small subunit
MDLPERAPPHQFRISRYRPLVLGFLLLAFGLLKAVMSWPYVPIWYHVIFTALLIPMTIMGGKLRARRANEPLQAA